MGREGEIGGSPLVGRHAVVTGASRGIGAAIAEALARLGAEVTLLGRNRAALEARAGSIGARAAVADVTDAKAVTDVFKVIGPAGILVNNAGVAKSAPFQRTDDAVWHEALNVNLWGAIHCTRGALPAMLEAGWGRIVNVASTAGITGFAYVTAYCASKHALVGLTRALAVETATKGV